MLGKIWFKLLLMVRCILICLIWFRLLLGYLLVFWECMWVDWGKFDIIVCIVMFKLGLINFLLGENVIVLGVWRLSKKWVLRKLI